MARVLIVSIVSALAAPAAAQTPVAPAALSFEDAVVAAQRAAESITIAHAQVDRSEATLKSAFGAYLPDVAGTASYQRTLATQFDNIDFGGGMAGSKNDALPFGQHNNWNLGLRVTQPLFDGFRTMALTQQAEAGVQVMRLGVQSTRAQVVLQVAQAYYDAVLAQRQVEIAQVTLQQAEQTLSETQLGFKQGATPEFDVVRAEVARDNQKTLVVQFTVQRDVTFVQLRRLVGVPLDAPLSLTTGLDVDDVQSIVATARSAAGVATGDRIAIAQARETVAADQAAVDAAKRAQLPTIAAVSDLGFVNYQKHPFNNAWFTNWTLGVALSWPIFDRMQTRGQIRLREADLAGARAQLQQTAEISQVEAAQAAAAVAAAATQVESSTRTASQAKRAFDIAELRFQQGASTHLELVDTRVQLEQSLLTQAKAAHDLRLARLRQELLPGLPLGGTP